MIPTKLAFLLTSTVVIAALAVACSGAVAGVNADGGATDSGASAQGADGGKNAGDGSVATSTDASATNGTDAGMLSPLCPSGAPAQGSSCTTEGLECEYGSVVDITCDTLATCTQSAWSVVGPSSRACGASPDASACPGTLAEAQAMNAQCTPFGQSCLYPDGVCECTSDHSGAPIVWTCFPTAGCPYPRPRIGSLCTMGGQQCDYSTCGDSIACTNGLWVLSNGGCHP